MSFANVKLKHVETKDKSAPQLTGYMTDGEIHTHIGKLLDYVSTIEFNLESPRNKTKQNKTFM